MMDLTRPFICQSIPPDLLEYISQEIIRGLPYPLIFYDFICGNKPSLAVLNVYQIHAGSK